MPAIQNNLKDFLVNSDYPLDKVVYTTTGIATSATDFVDITIPHGLSFMPLPVVQWSLVSDFTTCYEVTERGSELIPPSFPYICTMQADSTNILLGFDELSFGVLPTIYYRIFCFAFFVARWCVNHKWTPSLFYF